MVLADLWSMRVFTESDVLSSYADTRNATGLSKAVVSDTTLPRGTAWKRGE